MNIGACSNINFTGGKIRFEAFKVTPRYVGDEVDEDSLGIKTVDVKDIVEINHNYIDVKKPSETPANESKSKFGKQKEKVETERYFYKGDATEMMDHYRRLKEIPGDSAILECNDKGKKYKFYFNA